MTERNRRYNVQSNVINTEVNGPAASKGFIQTLSDIGISFQSVPKKLMDSLQPVFDMAEKAGLITEYVDLEGVEEKWRSLALRIAESGWTLPMHMDFDKLFDLLETDTLEEVETLILDSYKTLDNYEALKNSLLENIDLQDFHLLLEQCFQCYEDGNFQITIPSLLSIFEAYSHRIIFPEVRMLSEYQSDKSFPKNLVKRYRKVHENAQEKTSYDDILYISTVKFLELIFLNNAFNEDLVEDKRPPMINRHRVLHGRDDISLWKEADALRLFNALDTLNYFNRQLEEDIPNFKN